MIWVKAVGDSPSEQAMPDLDPELTLNPDTAFYRPQDPRVQRQGSGDGPDEGSNPSDDKAIDIMEFQPDDVVEEEVASAIEALNDDQKLDLIALAWIGRGDFSFDEWAEARNSAREVEPAQIARYILGMPTVSDYLEAALSQLGYSLDDYSATRSAPRSGRRRSRRTRLRPRRLIADCALRPQHPHQIGQCMRSSHR
jgi:hypothetical protein